MPHLLGHRGQGAILVGLNGWWKADEILYGLQDSGATVLVADRKRFERIADRLDEAPDLAHVFLIDADPTTSRRHRGWPRSTASTSWPPSRPPSFPDADIAEDDAAVIFYTSGTTGKPKGAISTHRSMIANLQNTMYSSVAGAMVNPAAASCCRAGRRPDRVAAHLAAVPRVRLPLGPGGGPAGRHQDRHPRGRFHPDTALELIQDHRVTVWATVPTMVWRVCEHPGRHDYDTSTVTSVAFGGSPSADELQRKVGDTFPNVRPPPTPTG